jgi:ABC-2 type transport system ATP-binding protein
MKSDFGGALRLEVVLDPTATAPVAPPFVVKGVTVGRRLIGDVAPSDLTTAIAWARELQDVGTVEEFSIGPATLEDVYVRRVTPETRDEQEEAGAGVAR